MFHAVKMGELPNTSVYFQIYELLYLHFLDLHYTLLTPSSSSTPESVDLPEVVPVEIAFFTTSARDTDIDTPSNEVDAEPKVMRICNVSKMKDRP